MGRLQEQHVKRAIEVEEEGTGDSGVNWSLTKHKGDSGGREGGPWTPPPPASPVDPPFGKVLKALSSTTFPNLNKASYSYLNS